MTTAQLPDEEQILAGDDGPRFTPTPEGQFASVCCDVVDLGLVKSTFEGKTTEKHKIRLIFQLAEINPDNDRPYTVSQWFTLSLNERANLRKFMEQWRGKAYMEDEVKHKVNIAKMLGVGALLQIVHVERGGKIYANINSIMRLPNGYPAPKIDPQYVRVKDRPKDGAPPPNDAPPHEDDDLPF